ncbi:RNA polymerase sigma factor RpoH [Suttonella indologenes]|uniref:RNA polymerase sigma factor RpoH n=1 Tax=Suttonella indologenes TaxID=13276 RepID=A0A380MZN5_9GAMM|nr:RNA polymerase sigma factor RpoH [Suttonella indologenes]SUO96947.1 Heat shock regulatory protein F33.4 [Suttonella indologenes]
MTATAISMQNSQLPVAAPSFWLTPSSDIDLYIAKVRQIPVLEAEQERELAEQLQKHQSLEAAQVLIVHHLKFVVHIARGFLGYGLPLGDLIQEGNIGLMKAVKRFEPQRGVRLISFAVHWIKSEIHEYVIRNFRMMKIATTKAQRKLFFNLRSMKKSTNWLNENEAQAIADELDVSIKDVYEMESRLQGQDIAFDPLDNDEEDSFAPSAWLVDENIDPARSTEREEQTHLMHRRLHLGLNKLDARSREIVETRWLNEDKATLQSLADKYQVSAERIRQIEQQALAELKTSISA